MGRLKVHWGQDLSFLCAFYPGQNFIFRNFLMVNWSKIWIWIYTTCFFLKVKQLHASSVSLWKNGEFFYPFFARSNCNMLCLLSVDDVCVLFIVYVRICVAAVNLTLQDSLLLFTRMSAQWEIAKKCKHIWTKWFFFQLVLFNFWFL